MEWFQALTTLALGGLFGGILAFSALFAPLVFTKLPMEHAGPFIRAVFPWYYLYVISIITYWFGKRVHAPGIDVANQ
jgi:hypothetical protein